MGEILGKRIVQTPDALSPQALYALWVTFGPQSKLAITPADIHVVGEIQAWLQRQGAGRPAAQPPAVD